jgi:hypothetical protein
VAGDCPLKTTRPPRSRGDLLRIAPDQLQLETDFPESEKLDAVRVRRYASDYSATYSIEERLIDLAGPIGGAIQ